ncbi:hypothetical protein FDC02_05175 [Clostridium botulinum]|nr:hypothetical protein [Clostridium botulinum]
MSPNILLNVKNKLESQSDLNSNQIDKLISNMRYWKIGKIIYPNMIKSLLFLNYKQVYSMLDMIKDMGILEYNYELYCHTCEKFLDKKILRRLNEFPEEIYCDDGHKLNPFDDTILIYRVIYDGK